MRKTIDHFLSLASHFSQRFRAFSRCLQYSLSTIIKHEIDNSCAAHYGLIGGNRGTGGSLLGQPDRERGGYFPQKEKRFPPQKRLPLGPVQEKRLRVSESLMYNERCTMNNGLAHQHILAPVHSPQRIRFDSRTSFSSRRMKRLARKLKTNAAKIAQKPVKNDPWSAGLP